MGCDIHMYREVRGKDGAWHCLPDIYKYFRVGEDDQLSSACIPDAGRDYVLFGILSYVVRCGTSDSIGEDRGIPEDVCGEIQSARDGWDCDGHSHGYATLGELDDIWQRNEGKFTYTTSNGEVKEIDDLSYFFVGWVNSYVRPFAWDGDDSVRIVYWFDN